MLSHKQGDPNEIFKFYWKYCNLKGTTCQKFKIQEQFKNQAERYLKNSRVNQGNHEIHEALATLPH